MDIFNKIEQLQNRDLAKYGRVGHGYLSFPKLVGEIGPRMKFNGNDVLVWSLNNYLGLANHPEIRKVDAEVSARWGLGNPMGSRMLTGNTDLHEHFEAEAARFVGKDDVYLINFGYQAVLSIVQALTDRRDVIVYDQLAHACIIDGMMMSLAKRFVYAHNDMAQLEDRLEKAKRITDQTGGGILVITEGVFGMRGASGKLDEIIALKKKFPFRIFIDDAHGFGVMGNTGAGTPEHYGVMDEIDVYFTTFAKSMASIGGFIAGDKRVMQFLRYTLRSQIYAKSMPLPLVEGAIKRLEMLRGMPELREKLWHIVNTLQSGLRSRGFDLGDTNSPVTPVYLHGSDIEAMHIVKDLREHYGIFVSGVTYPVIEKGKIMLRIIPTAAHTEEDVAYTLKVFTEIKDKLAAGAYADKPIPELQVA